MTAPDTITVQTYQPDQHLDTELAALGYTAVRGWPDQRPITADLVASRLTPPPDAPATLLALTRAQDRILGWAALRPAAPGGTARLWGPVVHPDHQRHHHGQHLLSALTNTPVFTDKRDQLTTAEIPASRQAAHAFFTAAGWHRCGTAMLLRAHPARSLSPLPTSDLVTTTPWSGDPHTAVDIARLYAATHPHHGEHTATTTLPRWRTDRRFRPDHLLLAHDHHGDVTGAALLYPLQHPDSSEPTEVLLADLLTDLTPHRNTTLTALLSAAIRTTAEHPDAALRIVTTNTDAATQLAAHGVNLIDQLRYYAPPAQRS